jgi:transposase
MPAPYSNDLRWKVVNAYQDDEGDQQEIAQRFSVSLSFVKRLWKRYQTHHDVEPARFGGWKRAKLDEQGEAYSLQWLEPEGDLTLAALGERYYQPCGERVSPSAMDRTWRKMKVSRKKNVIRPPTKERTCQSLKEDLWGGLESPPGRRRCVH